MNAASIDIAGMLAADTIITPALVLGTNLFVNKQPSEPDAAVTIFDTPTYPPSTSLSGQETYLYNSIQIRVRGNDFAAGYALSEKIMTSLHGRAQQPWGGALYSAIICSNPPVLLEYDDNNRFHIIINFEIQRR